MCADPRRGIPRTDHLLAHPDVAAAAQVLSEHVVRGIVRGAQERARRGEIAAEAVLEEIRSALGGRPAGSLRPVLNATGVIVHTNLGRAPLSPAARAAHGTPPATPTSNSTSLPASARGAAPAPAPRCSPPAPRPRTP